MKQHLVIAVCSLVLIFGACDILEPPPGSGSSDTTDVAVDSAALYFLVAQPETLTLVVNDTAWASVQLYDSSGAVVDSAHYLWNPPRGDWAPLLQVAPGIREQNVRLRATVPGTSTIVPHGGLVAYPGVNSRAWMDSIVVVATGYEAAYDTVVAGGCGLDGQGKVYCWSGIWPGHKVYVPAPVPGEIAFSKISVGHENFCGLTAAGAAYCWGNQHGLGVFGAGPDTETRSDPTPVSGGHTFEQITAGSFHFCALTPEGQAYCWGSGAWGELGVSPEGEACPRSANDSMPQHTYCRTEPAAVSGGLTFKQISAGGGHTCAITAEGLAYCWGQNKFDELGADTLSTKIADDGTRYSDVPLPVDSAPAFVHVTAGSSHSCGLTAEGSAHCWGSNLYGQIGDGRPDTVVVHPKEVSGGHSFRTIEASGGHTCGLTDSGEAWCWGVAAWSGNGVRDADTEACFAYNNYSKCNTRPVRVIGGHTFRSISVGVGGCGIASDGVARCWGDGARLGAGDHGNSPEPVPVYGSLPH